MSIFLFKSESASCEMKFTSKIVLKMSKITAITNITATDKNLFLHTFETASEKPRLIRLSDEGICFMRIWFTL